MFKTPIDLFIALINPPIHYLIKKKQLSFPIKKKLHLPNNTLSSIPISNSFYWIDFELLEENNNISPILNTFLINWDGFDLTIPFNFFIKYTSFNGIKTSQIYLNKNKNFQILKNSQFYQVIPPLNPLHKIIQWVHSWSYFNVTPFINSGEKISYFNKPISFHWRIDDGDLNFNSNNLLISESLNSSQTFSDSEDIDFSYSFSFLIPSIHSLNLFIKNGNLNLQINNWANNNYLVYKNNYVTPLNPDQLDLDEEIDFQSTDNDLYYRYQLQENFIKIFNLDTHNSDWNQVSENVELVLSNSNIQSNSLHNDFTFSLNSNNSLYFNPYTFEQFSPLQFKAREDFFQKENKDFLLPLIPLWGFWILPISLNLQWIFSQSGDQINKLPFIHDKRLLYDFHQRTSFSLYQNSLNITNNLFLSLLNEGDIRNLLPQISFDSNSYITNFENIDQNISDLFFEDKFNEENWDFNIRRIRFKPGYSRIWRIERLYLKKLYNLKFLYQRPLTRYLHRFRRQSVTVKIPYLRMRIDKIILMSHLFWDRNQTMLAFQYGLIYLNGLNVLNSNIYVMRGDFIQTVISIQYYLSYLNLRDIWYRQMWRWSNVDNDFKKKRIFKLNTNLILHAEDIPPHLEVDFFSLSIFILNNDWWFYRWDYINPPLAMTYVSYMYNWKYLN